MNSLFILLVVVGISAQHISKKAYNVKMLGQGTLAFSALSALTAALFFVFQLKVPFSMDTAVIPYAVLFGVGYGSAALFSLLAIACGSLSLTSLITSYSLIIPTIYGMMFLKEKVSSFLIVGLFLLMISLFLINFVKGDKSSGKITLKWLIYVAIAFFGNGMCSAVQKVQQVDFEGKYKAEFMVLSLFIVVLVLLVAALFTEKQTFTASVKKGILPIALCGIANGAVNLFVMILSNRMSASVMFPLVSAGSIVLTYFISRFWYKEKLTTMQNIGFVLGVASVIFLNL